MGRVSDEERLALKIQSEATEFGKDSYLEQKAKLAAAINTYKRKVRPDQLNEELSMEVTPQETEATEVTSGVPSITTR